jgi:hypothetical protein
MLLMLEKLLKSIPGKPGHRISIKVPFEASRKPFYEHSLF